MTRSGTFIRNFFSFRGRPVLAIIFMVKRSLYFVKWPLTWQLLFITITSNEQHRGQKGLVMDAREQRGLIIAATCRLHRNDDGTWLVPSQSNGDGGTYRDNWQRNLAP